jgi:D-aminopeptidase
MNYDFRVFISVDMEGISSVVDITHIESSHSEYAYYHKLMAGDLNAAIERARKPRHLGSEAPY